jgi:dephospho-CoA kinase
MVVGVAGKYCAGKSTVTGILAAGGYGVIDVDRLGHEALARRVADVRKTFGEAYIDAEGSVDRKKLGSLVFRDRGAMRRLEGIVHPEMVQMVRERLAAGTPDDTRNPGATRNSDPATPGTVINAALLFPMGLDALCDMVLWVTAPMLTRLRRARERDGLSVVEILRRFWAQRELDPQPSRSDVDIHSVENRGGIDRLRTQLAELSLLEE